jgi:hypothetical protein
VRGRRVEHGRRRAEDVHDFYAVVLVRLGFFCACRLEPREVRVELPLGDRVVEKPENKAKLVAILTYHVVPGKVMASDVVGLTSARTVNGQALSIAVRDGGVTIDNARVVKTDIATSNGVIHVIDTVLLPAAE